MKTIALFGASGGLGSKLTPLLLTEYNLLQLNSKDLDITDFKQVSDFFNSNDIDIVINLAGFNYDSMLHKYNTTNWDFLERQIKINAIGSANITACALPHMRKNKYGRIILVSSVLADNPVMGTSIYSACKGFVDSLVKTVAIENANCNINCNSLQLGYFDGGMTYKIPETLMQSVQNNIPMKRWGSIDELLSTITYLINTPYITGQNINISGGII